MINQNDLLDGEFVVVVPLLIPLCLCVSVAYLV
jgi:hypothetical protein